MRFRAIERSLIVLACLCITIPLLAQDIPIQPRWGGTEGPVQAFADAGNPSPMIPIQPCRVVDTRNPNGTYGGPKIVGGAAARSFDLNSGGCTGIPGFITAFAMNVTVVSPEANNGFLTLFPTGTTMPLASNLNFNLNEVKGNWAIVPVSAAGAMSVYSNVNTHVIVDLYGYFSGGSISDPLNSGSHVWLYGDTTAELLFVWNKNLASAFAPSIHGYSTSAVANHAAMIATANSATGKIYALRATNPSTTTDAAAIFAEATGATGLPNAIRGVLTSTDAKGNAIFGIAGPATWVSANSAVSGVRGQASSAGYAVGVFGEGTGGGMQGYRVDTTGALQTRGVVGGSGADGLWTPNNMTATGTKSFVEPHPTDASKVIKYVALEGPEAGTYFRGRARVSGGFAIIEVPEDFRMVTDEEGLTVQVTAIGRTAEFAVTEAGLHRIVVRANRDVDFFYHVNGVRKLYRDFQPIQTDPVEAYFKPLDPSDRVENHAYTPEVRERLIANGTYRPDGTVNMDTAERMGWAQQWRDAAEQQRMYAAAMAAQPSPYPPPPVPEH